MKKHSWKNRARVSGDWWNPVDDINALQGAVESGWDTVKQNVPGAQAVSDAFDTVVTNPTRDFLNTDVGKAIGPIVLTAVSSGAYGAISPYVGAQLASAAFALPGILKGDKSFVAAWTQEFVHRVSMLIDYLIHTGVPVDIANSQAGQVVTDALNACTDKMNQLGIDPSTIDFHHLAKLAGVSEHDAALWLSQKLQDMSIVTDNDWDPKTGAALPKPPNAMQKAMNAWKDAQAKLDAARVKKAQQMLSYSASAEREHLTSLLYPPQVHPSAPDLGPLSGAGPAPPPPAAEPQKGLSTTAKAGLGLGAGALILLLFL